MTIKDAIEILYHEATNEERKYSLEEINKARDHLLCWYAKVVRYIVEKEN